MPSDIRQANGAICWRSGMAIAADGAATAYGPPGLPGLDWLTNAGAPGRWYGIACTPSGTPYIQKRTDPAPGYYVSVTALVDHSKMEWDPARYVDSERIPYIVISPDIVQLGIKLGDLGWVRFGEMGCAAICADIGPHGKLGEGSIALASALGIPSSPKRGGVDSGVEWVVWPNSHSQPRWPRDFAAVAAAEYVSWGGDAALDAALA